MPEKSPENYTWITYAWVFGFAMLGGLVSFLRKVKNGHARAWNLVEFIGEIVTSAFAGVLTFYICQHYEFSQLLTAAAVGIAGHMGSRALFRLEGFFTKHFPPVSKDDK